jgi:hypothetical protein
VSGCTAPFLDCTAAAGCETNGSVDINNCGQCGKVCSNNHGTPGCASGNCSIACSSGWGNCDGNILNGCEKDVTNDVNNCGGCNNVCPVRPNARPTCAGGACGSECLLGYANCNGNAVDGCEVDTDNDANNCGSCATVCRLPRATAACSGGACVVSACAAGYGDCDGSAATGCETNTQSDPANCGRCGNVCPGNLCVAGACAIARTCQQLHQLNPTLPSGVYPIDPDGTGGLPQVSVYCEMSVLGGGWTLIQRTVWDFNDSRQLVTNQADFYANTYGAPTPGRAFRLSGRLWPMVQGATPMHMMVFVPRRTDELLCSPMYYTASGGLWNVSPPPAPATIAGYSQRVTIFEPSPMGGSQFVTTDVGSSASIGCVTMNGAVPWTLGFCCATCPTYGGALYSPPRPVVNYLNTADEFGNTIASRCSGGTAVFSGGYYALNSMEYFIR